MLTSTNIQITFSIKSEVQKVREEAERQAFIFSPCVHTEEKEKSKNAGHKLKTVYMEWKRKEAEKVLNIPFFLSSPSEVFGVKYTTSTATHRYYLSNVDIVCLVPKYFLFLIDNHGT